MHTSTVVLEKPRMATVMPAQRTTKCNRCGTRADNVCGAIATADLARLSSVAVAMTIDAGRGFIAEGDSADHFFNVTGGTVRLFKLLPDGRRQITGFADPGHFLGLAVSTTYAFSAEALDTVSLCRYPRRQLMQMVADYPAMKTRLLEVASNELVLAQGQMLLLGRMSARERLASFLLARALEPPLSPGAGPIAIVLPMARGDIADYLGLSVETVSRSLTSLARDGLIRIIGATRVIIHDQAVLRAVATAQVQPRPGPPPGRRRAD